MVFDSVWKTCHGGEMTDTKTRILDAAEALMLQHGADRTSLRMITTEADVNLAAINYHFGSKENLVDEVFARYVRPIIDAQLEGLLSSELLIIVRYCLKSEGRLKMWIVFKTG